jgi:tetratricopeptide (TPR) repeat protein
MAFWKKLFGGGDPRRVDYYREGAELLGAGKFHEALTSFRLALKESPGDTVVLQQIAVCYTRIGMTEEAAKHYGLAFIQLRSGRTSDAAEHLEAFLARPPSGPEAGQHVSHARATLAHLRGEAHDAGPEPPAHELF